MKKALVVSVILSFLSVAAGFAQVTAPSVVPLSDQALAAILAQPTGTECPQPQESVLPLDPLQGIQYKTCSATATCNDTSHVNVSCNFGGGGGSCTFQNQNCAAGIRGQVNCNGTITECPVCPCSPLQCCQCEATGACIPCCRCAGGTFSQCVQECGGM